MSKEFKISDYFKVDSLVKEVKVFEFKAGNVSIEFHKESSIYDAFMMLTGMTPSTDSSPLAIKEGKLPVQFNYSEPLSRAKIIISCGNSFIRIVVEEIDKIKAQSLLKEIKTDGLSAIKRLYED